MPRKSTKIKIEGTEFDRRVKLTDEDKILIREMYNAGNTSQRKLAVEFKVSRRLIQFILDPDKLTENRERREERGGSAQYYDKAKQTEAIREHRQYKEDLKQQGLIFDTPPSKRNE